MKAFQFNRPPRPARVTDRARSSCRTGAATVPPAPATEARRAGQTRAMRATNAHDGLTVHAVAGTHTVLLGFDLADPAGCLGFGIRRTDHTEDEAYWLRGMKSFASVVPAPRGLGMDFSLRQHPVQGFQWGDYSAKPEHDYTYAVVALGGAPGALTPLRRGQRRRATEAEDDGQHGVWFNRGVAGSQAFVKRFGQYTPPVGRRRGPPGVRLAVPGAGRGLPAFVDRAVDDRVGAAGRVLRVHLGTGLRRARRRPRRGAPTCSSSCTAATATARPGTDRDTDRGRQPRRRRPRRGSTTVVTWQDGAQQERAAAQQVPRADPRRACPSPSGPARPTSPREPSSGTSTSGHLVQRPRGGGAVPRLLGPARRPGPHHGDTPDVDRAAPTRSTSVAAPAGVDHDLLAPRAASTLLPLVRRRVRLRRPRASHITGAFGLQRGVPGRARRRPGRRPDGAARRSPPPTQAIPTHRPRRADLVGRRPPQGDRSSSGRQEHLTDFNSWVKFIHTKIILVDPLADDPTIAHRLGQLLRQLDDDNEENTLVIRGRAPRSAAARGAAGGRHLPHRVPPAVHALRVPRLGGPQGRTRPASAAGAWSRTTPGPRRTTRPAGGVPANARRSRARSHRRPRSHRRGRSRPTGRSSWRLAPIDPDPGHIRDVLRGCQGSLARAARRPGRAVGHQCSGAWRSAATASGSPSRSTRAWSWRPKANRSSSPGGPVTVTTGVRSPTVRLVPSGRRSTTPAGARPSARLREPAEDPPQIVLVLRIEDAGLPARPGPADVLVVDEHLVGVAEAVEPRPGQR